MKCPPRKTAIWTDKTGQPLDAEAKSELPLSDQRWRRVPITVKLVNGVGRKTKNPMKPSAECYLVALPLRFRPV
jgi:hypothetical protein